MSIDEYSTTIVPIIFLKKAVIFYNSHAYCAPYWPHKEQFLAFLTDVHSSNFSALDAKRESIFCCAELKNSVEIALPGAA